MCIISQNKFPKMCRQHYSQNRIIQSLKTKSVKDAFYQLAMSWRELREAILNAHKPIRNLFFTGLGNRLQFEDSIIAESIMLQFAEM